MDNDNVVREIGCAVGEGFTGIICLGGVRGGSIDRMVASDLEGESSEVYLIREYGHERVEKWAVG